MLSSQLQFWWVEDAAEPVGLLRGGDGRQWHRGRLHHRATVHRSQPSPTHPGSVSSRWLQHCTEHQHLVILVTGGDSEEDTPVQTVEIYDPSTGISCDMAATANLTIKNHAQIGLTICGGNNGTDAVDVCYKMDDEEFQEIEDVTLYGERDSPAMSWSSSEGFVICSNTTCDLLMDDNTVKEKYIALYPMAT